MHLRNLLSPLALLGSLALSASAARAGAPDVEAQIKFPDDNPFGRVTNGVSHNLLHVRVANHGPEPVTVTRVRGQYREAGGKERALRNTTTMPLGLPVGPGGRSPLIPYKFHSENKPGEAGLRVWVDYVDSTQRAHTVLGYDSTITVVEPKGSWFDLELLFLYALLGSALAAIAYTLYGSYLSPSPAAPASGVGKKRPTAVTAKSASIVDGTDGSRTTAKLAGEVDEEWVPEHHLRARKTRKGGNTSGTSGDESDARRRKGRK
ncbi:hypothetical protein JCM10450v2_007897 [Rhodotorula kratochvilovae]